MALKNFKLCIDNDGITPNMITNAGTQGDHGVTCLEFELSDEIYDYFVQELADENIMYRFDIYNGGGSTWKSDVFELTSNNISLTLEERHTRYGGKVIVYVVVTALSADNKTEMELYNSPLVLCLENRPDGIYRQVENYESLASISENVKSRAEQVSALAIDVEEKLKNGEFDGIGVEKTEILNDELIITYTNGISCNLGNVKGEKGDRGEKGNTGENGKDAITDQIYSPTSVNAQSGIAVAKALENYYNKDEVDNLYAIKSIENEDDNNTNTKDPQGRTILTLSGEDEIVNANGYYIANVRDPVDDTDVATKKYVDDKVTNATADGVDLTNYVKKTDYATSTEAGVIRLITDQYCVRDIGNGALAGVSRTYEQYTKLGAYAFISKGTLENVLAKKIGDIETLLGGI